MAADRQAAAVSASTIVRHKVLEILRDPEKQAWDGDFTTPDGIKIKLSVEVLDDSETD